MYDIIKCVISYTSAVILNWNIYIYVYILIYWYIYDIWNKICCVWYMLIYSRRQIKGNNAFLCNSTDLLWNYCNGFQKYLDSLAKNINAKNAHIWIRIAFLLLWFFVLTHLFLLITVGQLTDSQKAQIIAYCIANQSMTEIGRKIGHHKSAICKYSRGHKNSPIHL